MWEFSSGELCARNTLWCKERWRAAIGCPQQRMPSPVPLGRLCSDLAGSGRPMGSTGILGQSHKQPRSRAASSSGLSLSPGPPACGDAVPDKQIPEGFGYLQSLHRLHHGMKLHWARRALVCAILGPFWASCPGCVLIPPHPCLRTCWPILQPGQAEPHLALFSSHPRVTALLVQRCCSHPLPPTLHPSGNATRAALVEVSPQPPLHTRPTALLCAGRAGSAPPHSQDGCCQFWGGYVGLSLVTPPWDCTQSPCRCMGTSAAVPRTSSPGRVWG